MDFKSEEMWDQSDEADELINTEIQQFITEERIQTAKSIHKKRKYTSVLTAILMLLLHYRS